MGLRRWLAGGKSHSSQTTPSQTNNTLSLSEVQVGALAVRRRLGTQDLDLNAPVTASCNSDLYLPAGCKVTPLGYAVLSAQHDLLALLLQQGADPNKHVGLPHRFNLTPLHVAVVRDDPTAVSLLLANGAAANAPLDRKSGASGPPASSMRESSTTKSSSSSSTQQPVFAQVMHALWSPGPDSHWRRVDQGDTALHLAVATSNTEALRALLDFPSTDVNRSSPAGRTPLSMACELEHLQLARMLVQHPRIDVNAGGPIFTSIKVLSEPLLQLLLDAGASLTAVNAERLTPLRFAVLRATEGNTNLAEIVKQLLRSGAVPDPECRKHAKRQGWPRVEAALENAHLIAPQQPASAAPGGWAPPPIIPRTDRVAKPSGSSGRPAMAAMNATTRAAATIAAGGRRPVRGADSAAGVRHQVQDGLGSTFLWMLFVPFLWPFLLIYWIFWAVGTAMGVMLAGVYSVGVVLLVLAPVLMLLAGYGAVQWIAMPFRALLAPSTPGPQSAAAEGLRTAVAGTGTGSEAGAEAAAAAAAGKAAGDAWGFHEVCPEPFMSVIVAFVAWLCVGLIYDGLVRLASSLLRRRLAADHPVLQVLCYRHRAARGPRSSSRGEESSRSNNSRSSSSSTATRDSGAVGGAGVAAEELEAWQTQGCFIAALALRVLLGLGFWHMVAALVLALVGYETVVVLWLGLATGAGRSHPQVGVTEHGEREEGGDGGVPSGGPGPAAGTGAAADATGKGQGDSGQCCVCMSSRAVLGFVHGDVVHCCLCASCEGELRRRGRLDSCLICKRPPLAVTKVVLA